MRTMKAAVFLRPDKICIEEKPIPKPGLMDAAQMLQLRL